MADWSSAFDKLERMLVNESSVDIEAAARLAIVEGREAMQRAEELSAENAALRAYLRDHASTTTEAH